jgi:hypothetical protein
MTARPPSSDMRLGFRMPHADRWPAASHRTSPKDDGLPPKAIARERHLFGPNARVERWTPDSLVASSAAGTEQDIRW